MYEELCWENDLVSSTNKCVGEENVYEQKVRGQKRLG